MYFIAAYTYLLVIKVIKAFRSNDFCPSSSFLVLFFNPNSFFFFTFSFYLPIREGARVLYQTQGERISVV